ncbi:uncharacterized protein LOC114758864 [Neltuma alba]|uniref:uncharacterized protein LOC114758864 n=1 Tax=Neltuma alba TaxID=207710 RepID=UPI0010A59107|nr:uncharacterized protein LOC114758864 [Prosopis alba]
MAISLNSVMSFNSTKLQPKYQDASRYSVGASLPKATKFTPFFVTPARRMQAKEKRPGTCLSVADSDQLAADLDGKNSSGDAERSTADDESPSINPAAENVQFQGSSNANPESKSQTAEVSNSSAASPNSQSTTKKSPLTARERLRAARVLSRYTESKESSNKSDMGSRVLDALKESDRGKKRSRLPEAPTNLFDDSNRGVSKPGFNFQFPGGFDLFLIVFSFVFISTLMFATTFIVWKVGAIHFNEY